MDNQLLQQIESLKSQIQQEEDNALKQQSELRQGNEEI